MKKWYQKDWGIFTLLILFLPVGLYILWKKSDWSSSKKITVTSCFALLFLIGLIFEPGDMKIDNVIPLKTEPNNAEDFKNIFNYLFNHEDLLEIDILKFHEAIKSVSS